MQVESGRRTATLNLIFTLLALLGSAIAILGVAFDLVPGASPGLSIPQLLMIFGGLVLAFGAFYLRRPSKRHLALVTLKKNLRTGIIVVMVTLLVLEFVLVAAGLSTYFPHEIPEKFLDPVPWWTCDESGCHYVYEEMIAACERGDLRDLRCIVNRQGFHDTEDFVVGVDFEERLRDSDPGGFFCLRRISRFRKILRRDDRAEFPRCCRMEYGDTGSGHQSGSHVLRGLCANLATASDYSGLLHE